MTAEHAPATARGALWEDESYPLDTRLQGAIGMINFQAEIITHRNMQLELKEEEIKSLHKLMEGMRTRIYQLSGDMNVLAMESYYNKKFVKEINDVDTEFHVVYVDGIGCIAVACLGGGMDSEATGSSGPVGTESSTGATTSGQTGISDEGA